MDKRRIYMDYSATTPLKTEVLEKMLPYLTEEYGNASSFHSFGRKANKAVEQARAQLSKALNAGNGQIYMTSGGTEADNWAIKGMTLRKNAPGKHIITSAVEHHAILHCCESLEKQGFTVTYLPVNAEGFVEVENLVNALRPETALVSIMMVNNEVGTIMPIKALAAAAHEKGVPFHTDAVQAVGSIPVDVQDLGVDLLSLSAHKFYGPKGVGALYTKNGIFPNTFMEGGAQERGHRAGTYNTPGIVGMGAAAELATAHLEDHMERLIALRDRLIEGFRASIDDVHLNGPETDRHPGNVNMSFGGIEGEGLLLMLDLAGIGASSGSACTSGSLEASHVLTAMKTDDRYLHSTVRFTIGDFTTEEDIDTVIERTKEAVIKLRALSPIY